jgi:hypothetical protein
MRDEGSLCVWLGSAFLLLGSEPAAAVHKWIDDDGIVHYGNHAPLGKSSESIRAQPPPTEEDVRRATERSESMQRRVNELEREASSDAENEFSEATLPPRVAQSVPLRSVGHFRCERGGLVSVGDSVEMLLEKCGPPEGEYVVTHPLASTYPRSGWEDDEYHEYETVTFWRYAPYGKFPCRFVLRDGIVRQIELELAR